MGLGGSQWRIDGGRRDWKFGSFRRARAQRADGRPSDDREDHGIGKTASDEGAFHVARNPSGGLTRSGPLPADLVANGAGSLALCPCVTCAGKQAAIAKPAAKQKGVFKRIRQPLWN